MRSQVQELCQRHTAKAVETLASLMEDPKTSASNRITAAKALLEYGYGKPQAAPQVGGGAGGVTIVIEGQQRGDPIPVNGRGQEPPVDV